MFTRVKDKLVHVHCGCLAKKKHDRESEIMVGAHWQLKKKMVWNKFRLYASVQSSTFFDWLYYFFLIMSGPVSHIFWLEQEGLGV